MNKTALELIDGTVFGGPYDWSDYIRAVFEAVARAAREEMREQAAHDAEGPVCVEQPCKHESCTDLIVAAKCIRALRVEAGK